MNKSSVKLNEKEIEDNVENSFDKENKNSKKEQNDESESDINENININEDGVDE